MYHVCTCRKCGSKNSLVFFDDASYYLCSGCLQDFTLECCHIANENKEDWETPISGDDCIRLVMETFDNPVLDFIYGNLS